jgi:hypothetical protein
MDLFDEYGDSLAYNESIEALLQQIEQCARQIPVPLHRR